MASLSCIIKTALEMDFTGLDLLLERKDISRIEKIEALELAGAVILHNESTPLFPKAFDYWRRSFHLRTTDTDGGGPIIKILPENLKKTGRIVEWATSEELERATQNHSEYQVQSFLVLSRILSARGWGSVKKLYEDTHHRFHYCRNFSDIMRKAEEGIPTSWLHIQWSMLEIIRRFDPKENGLLSTTVEVVSEIQRTLDDFKHKHNPFLNANTIEISFALILVTDQFPLKDEEFVTGIDFHSFDMLLLFEMLAVQPQLINENTMKYLSQLVHRQKRSGQKFHRTSHLNRACFSFGPESRLPTVELLLRAGDDPNSCVEHTGNGPLHHLAFRVPDDEATARVLLNSGAHLDRVNKNGQTPADTWIERNPSKRRCDMPSWLRAMPSLMCLSAGVIRSNRIPYLDLPITLHAFIQMH